MAEAGRRPRTALELIRAMDDRIRLLENATRVSLEDWVLEVDDADQLTARNTTTDVVVVLATP